MVGIGFVCILGKVKFYSMFLLDRLDGYLSWFVLVF